MKTLTKTERELAVIEVLTGIKAALERIEKTLAESRQPEFQTKSAFTEGAGDYNFRVEGTD